MRITVDRLAKAIEDQISGYEELAGYLVTRMVQPPVPDRCVTVTPYSLERDVVLPPTVVSVQVRVRAPMRDPDEATRIGEVIRRRLVAHQPVWEAGRATRIKHLSAGWLGADKNDRLERTDNYEITLT